MLRLSPPDYQRLVQAKSFDIVYGGGEANVAFALAQLGVDAAFVTTLPANPIGDAAINELRRYGVDTRHIKHSGERIGIYYCEKGAAMRPSKVIYDRKNSAISLARSGDFNWPEIFAGAEWFHFTGITPALHDNVADLCLEACREAKNMGLTVSCDLNFRKNLWTPAKANEVMTKMMSLVDLLIANEEDAEKVFGIKADATDISSGHLSIAGYQQVCRSLVERFNFKQAAITLRESMSASENGWSGLLYDKAQFYHGRRYVIHIVDRVGGGDAFAAGLIYAMLHNFGGQKAIDFAVAASALKHTIEGDFNLVSLEEIKALVGGDASGRVQR